MDKMEEVEGEGVEKIVEVKEEGVEKMVEVTGWREKG